MLKSILKLSNVQLLNKTEQKQIKGRGLMCIIICGPGDGNTPIYDNDHDTPIAEEVGCVCS
ncbi:hypothetical protein [Kordia sp.]|uniref:hypothetical protein n=1 Tax=Kordia sp. TaxID=1965332 RepID=UPI003D266A69